jgi:hypothetical protein
LCPPSDFVKNKDPPEGPDFVPCRSTPELIGTKFLS